MVDRKSNDPASGSAEAGPESSSGRIHPIVAGLVVAGLRRVAPAALSNPKAIEAIASAGPDGVPLAPYRQMLADAFAYDGGRALMAAGVSLKQLKHPLLFVMLNSDTPTLLVEKENRLEGFIHSRHRVRIEASGEGSLMLRHQSLVAARPEPTENLAACGQHVALFEEIGCRGLRCYLGDDDGTLVYDDGVFLLPPPTGHDRWRFEWTTYTATRKPMPGLDEVLLSATADPALDEMPEAVAGVHRVVRRDLGRTWKIAEVASALGMSPRSLQRALSEVDERYSDLVDRIRNDEAARLLQTTEMSVTEVGYVCGFADSAHFSRSFKRRFGAPPSTYRHQA